MYYVCKYTPVELLKGFHTECTLLGKMPENFDLSDATVHTNLCGFSKSVTEAVMEGSVDELLLVNCCDCMRRIYDAIARSGKCKFLYMLDLPHEDSTCEKERFARSLLRFMKTYETYSKKTFDTEAFLDAFKEPKLHKEPYIGVLGVRVNKPLEDAIQSRFSLPVRNLTCNGNREVFMNRKEWEKMPLEDLIKAYADTLLNQIPCFRMNTNTRRNPLFLDANLKGIIYHTIKFCDYYGFEYASVKQNIKVPILKIETDFTKQSAGQLMTRIEAFSETISQNRNEKTMMREEEKKQIKSGNYYVAGIDSGSTSTDVVILNPEGRIVAGKIIPTGGGATVSAQECLLSALDDAGISRENIVRIVTTGYGRAYIDTKDESITEITCHAKGAHYLNPNVRTVIDIGGQDIKAIAIDEHGAVKNFLMNDKCAAGTGRFLELMASTLGLSLGEMSKKGLEWKENVSISSMCTVFAESEVVSLVAQNKAKEDIIHGLNVSVASKVIALVQRLGRENQKEYILTGGVSKNRGVLNALEEKLGETIHVYEESQICGALGAALFALEECKEA